jgi:hypothetical protein
VRYLERELEKRVKLGKAVTVAGLAAAITATSISATACSLFEQTTDGIMVTDGDMAPPEYTESVGEIEPGEDVMVTDGEPALPTVYLPEFEEYRHLLEDPAALYDFLLTYCRENGSLEGEPTYSVMSITNWSWSHTDEQENKYIEYFDAYTHWNPQTQQDEQIVIGLVFEPTEESKSGVPSYLWTAVTVETLIIAEALAGDMPT